MSAVSRSQRPPHQYRVRAGTATESFVRQHPTGDCRPSTGRLAKVGPWAQYSPLPTGESEALNGYSPKAYQSDGHSFGCLSSFSSDSTICSRILPGGQEFLEGARYQLVSAAVIIANALVIGFETDFPGWYGWDVVENTFLLFFTVELAARLLIYGSRFFACSENPELVWNVFDFAIVSLGLLDLVLTVMAPCLGFMSFTTVFRIIRLLRILRIFRIIRFLKQLYLLAYGFVEAAIAVFWVTFLMFFVLYVCAIALTRMYGSLPEEDPNHEFFSAHYGNIPGSMWTLFELMSQPDLTVYREVICNHPSILPFLVCFIIFGSFGMIALLTGVISESMFEKNEAKMEEERAEREQKRLKFAQRCRDVFHAIDVDGDGRVSREELNDHPEDIKELFSDEDLHITPETLHTLFDALDNDMSGTIEQEEFEGGILRMTEGIRTVDIIGLQTQLRKCHLRVEDCHQQIDCKFALMDGRLEDCHQQIDCKFALMDGRLDALTKTLRLVFSAVAELKLASTSTGPGAGAHIPAEEDRPSVRVEAVSDRSVDAETPPAVGVEAVEPAIAALTVYCAGSSDDEVSTSAAAGYARTEDVPPHGLRTAPFAHRLKGGPRLNAAALPAGPAAAPAQPAGQGPPHRAGDLAVAVPPEVARGAGADPAAPALGTPPAAGKEAGPGPTVPLSGALAASTPVGATAGPVPESWRSSDREMPSLAVQVTVVSPLAE